MKSSLLADYWGLKGFILLLLYNRGAFLLQLYAPSSYNVCPTLQLRENSLYLWEILFTSYKLKHHHFVLTCDIRFFSSF